MGRTDTSSCPETIFTAPHGFFDAATLYVQQADQHVVHCSSQMGQNQAGFQLGFGNHELLTDVEVHGNKELSNLSNEEESVHFNGVEEVDHVVGVLERWTCKGCAAVFHSLDQQRAHFKSDFHRFNMKRRLAGKEAVTEDEFEAIVQGRGEQNDDDLSSISGSDAESSAEEATDDHSGAKGHPLQQGSRRNCILVTFPVSGQRLLIWRCLIAADKEVLQWERGFTDTETSRQRLSVTEVECLRRLRCLTAGALPGKRPLWVILLAAGGHFAGLVVDSQGGSVLAHKTFHRYVVRAKAGGRQTTHDATGRAPKSAGASLRRYNEQALQEEIRKLLANWSEYLRAASHLFVHAPSSNSQAIFGGEPALLNHSDHRIHRIPFTTRRPTMKEAKRICHLLGTIYYVREGSAALGTVASVDIDDAAAVGIRSLSNASNVLLESEKTGKSIKAKLPKGKLNDVTSLASAVAVTSVPAAADEVPATYMTPLHEAARDGNNDKVLELLEEGADPCIQETGGRTPYAVAKDKVTRNVFRRFMANHPDMWDWHAADVPSPLTDELEATQAAKQAEKDAKRKAREKERKKLRKVQEAQEKARQAEAKEEAKAAELAAAAAATVRYDKGHSKGFSKALGSLDPKSKEFQEAMVRAQEQERETRAAAAEFRLRALAISKQEPIGSTSTISSSKSVTPQNVCSCCGETLVGKVPFSRYEYQYCSTKCVRVHRLAMEET